MATAKVLVYPCASGVGQEIYAALAGHKDVEVFGANSGDVNPGKFLFRPNYIGNAPLMSDELACVDWLRTVVKEKNISFIFPAYDDAQVWLKTREAQFDGARVITSPLATTELCRSKLRTYECLSTISVRCPTVYPSAASVNDVDFPVFIKPECGEGSKGCFKIGSKLELESRLEADHIICEFLPGDEYTVDCFSGCDGQLHFVGARRRKLVRAGMSVITESVADDEGLFSAMALAINSKMEFLGAWFFQVKHSVSGELCLMEVAPRVPGAMALYRSMGVNFPLLSIYAHSQMSTRIIRPQLSEVTCCKIYTNHFSFSSTKKPVLSSLYVDLDDTLIVPANHCLSRSCTSVANPLVMSLVYEAIAREVAVHLITRHRGDVSATLESARVHRGIFSSVLHLTEPSAKKSSLMVKENSALLDDSFREREDAALHGIMAFDVDAIDILRDLLHVY